MVGLEGGGDQQVFPRRQREALGHLPQVDVGPAASFGCVVAEEILVLVVVVVRSLDGQDFQTTRLILIQSHDLGLDV